MGKTAAKKLFSQILNKEKAVEHIVLKPKLVIRETTADKN